MTNYLENTGLEKFLIPDTELTLLSLCADPVRMLAVGLILLSAACSQNQVIEPATVIHEDAHSGGSIVAFSQSGNLLASGGWGGTLRLWAMPGGKPLRHWSSHTDSVNGVAFIDNDRYVITAGYDSRLIKHDRHGTTVTEVVTPTPITHMAANDASARIVTGHADGAVRLWRVDDLSLREERHLHRGPVKAVAMHAASGRYASSGRDGQVFVWSEAGEARTLQPPPMDSWSLAFSPDGQWLAGGSWFRLYRWDVAMGSLTILPTEHHGIIKSLQYMDAGRQLATISRQTDSAVYFLEADSGKVLRRFQKHALCGSYIAVSPDMRYLATISDDASVRIWLLERKHVTE